MRKDDAMSNELDRCNKIVKHASTIENAILKLGTMLGMEDNTDLAQHVNFTVQCVDRMPGVREALAFVRGYNAAAGSGGPDGTPADALADDWGPPPAAQEEAEEEPAEDEEEEAEPQFPNLVPDSAATMPENESTPPPQPRGGKGKAASIEYGD